MKFQQSVPFGVLFIVFGVVLQQKAAGEPQVTATEIPQSTQAPGPSWFDNAVSSVSNAAKSAAKDLEGASKNFASVIGNKTESARKTISEQVETAKNVIGEKTESALKTISEGMESMKNTVNGTINNIKNAVQPSNLNQTQNS